MWAIKLSKQVYSKIDEYGGKQRRLFEEALGELADDPYVGKPLVGELKGYWSLRIGDFRAIYTIRKKEIVVEVLRLQHRKMVYEKFRGK